METERDYFEQLLSTEAARDSFRSLLTMDSDILLDQAMKIQEQLESGDLENAEEKAKMQTMNPEEREEFHLRKLEEAEGLVCLLFAAVRDKVKTKEPIHISNDLNASSSRRTR